MAIKGFVLFVIGIIESYAQGISYLVSQIINPTAEFLDNYSPSLGESVRNISSVVTNILMLLPVVVFSIIIGSIVGQDEGIATDSFGTIELQSVLVSVLTISSVSALIISHYIMEDEIINTLYISSLPAVGALLVTSFDPPQLYIAMLAVVYGIGGYTATKVSLENPIPHDYVYDELQPHKYIMKVSYASALVLIPLLGGAYYLESGNVYLVLSLSSGLVSHITTVLQNPKYKTYYTKIEPKIDSMIWILTPRLLLILGLGGLVFSGPQVAYSVLVFAPCIFGLVFNYYIDSKASKLMGDRFLQDVQGRYRPLVVSTNSDVDINKSKVDDGDVELDVRIKFSIDGDTPDDDTRWIEATEITHGIYESVDSIRRISESDRDQIEHFYDQLVGQIISEKSEDIRLENLPKGLRQRYLSQMAKKELVDNQRIMDAQMRDSDVSKKDKKLYSDGF